MVLVEVARRSFLASVVPVIVNAILNEHQIVVDIVAFVNKGDFPRSRLGEKQRGKILASWVTRKLRTVAQFGIRDPDSALSDVTETMEPRTGTRNGSVITSSLRNVEPSPHLLEERAFEAARNERRDYGALPTGISEMPDQNYNNSIVGSPMDTSDITPTDNRMSHFELPSSPHDREEHLPTDTEEPEALPPRVGPKPGQTPLPAVEGREAGDLWSLPSQSAPTGGLRVQNAGSDDEDGADNAWKDDAIMHMNLAGRQI